MVQRNWGKRSRILRGGRLGGSSCLLGLRVGGLRGGLRRERRRFFLWGATSLKGRDFGVEGSLRRGVGCWSRFRGRGFGLGLGRGGRGLRALVVGLVWWNLVGVIERKRGTRWR